MLSTEQAKHCLNNILIKSNIRQTWKTIKLVLKTKNPPLADTFIINGKCVTDKTVISKKFNEYFVNIGPSLANKINTSGDVYQSYMKCNYITSF